MIIKSKNLHFHERANFGSAPSRPCSDATDSLLTAFSPFEEYWEIRFLCLWECFYWDCGVRRGRVSVYKCELRLWSEIRELVGYFQSNLALSRLNCSR